MRPDLVTLFTGTNDVVRPRFDAALVGREVEDMQRRLVAAGATVLGFTLPDLSAVLPLARPIAHRVRDLNDALREASKASGALLVDFARYPVSSDPRLWSEDRLHANSTGHARIADALAWALRLPGTDQSWAEQLPPAPHPSWRAIVAAEVRWGRRYFVPWAWRHLHGRSSGDGLAAKRPQLLPVLLQ